MPHDATRGVPLWHWFVPLVLLVAGTAAGFALTRHGLNRFDAAWLLWFRNGSAAHAFVGPPWMGQFWITLSAMGDLVPHILIGVLALLGLAACRRWHVALWLAGLLLSGMALTGALKHWIGRPRPQLVTHLVEVHSASYPSGHALQGTLFYVGAAVLVAAATRRMALGTIVFVSAAILTAMIGISRVALGVHYPTDVIAGWVIGGAWIWLWFDLAAQWWPQACIRPAA